MTFRCFLPAWIFGWVVAVFLPSVLIAFLGISRTAAVIGVGFDRLPASAWQVADDVGPAVKLMIGGLLLLGFLALGSARIGRPSRYAAAIGIGLGTMTLTIAVIPSSLSRGFAAALTGSRLGLAITPIYLIGGALAGIVFVWSADRCRRAHASQSGK